MKILQTDCFALSVTKISKQIYQFNIEQLERVTASIKRKTLSEIAVRLVSVFINSAYHASLGESF